MRKENNRISDESLIRYDGCYSNAARGKRKKPGLKTEVEESDDPLLSWDNSGLIPFYHLTIGVLYTIYTRRT